MRVRVSTDGLAVDLPDLFNLLTAIYDKYPNASVSIDTDGSGENPYGPGRYKLYITWEEDR